MQIQMTQSNARTKKKKKLIEICYHIQKITIWLKQKSVKASSPWPIQSKTVSPKLENISHHCLRYWDNLINKKILKLSIKYHCPRYWDWSSAAWQRPLWQEAWTNAERGGRFVIGLWFQKFDNIYKKISFQEDLALAVTHVLAAKGNNDQAQNVWKTTILWLSKSLKGVLAM